MLRCTDCTPAPNARGPAWIIDSYRWNTCLLVLGVLALGSTVSLWEPAPALAKKTAPLDTLIHAEPENPWIRFSQNNSRKVLPDVQASKVPQLTPPGRPPRLDDPVLANYQFHLAQVAAAGGNFELAKEKLQLANKAESGRARMLLWQATQSLRQFDPGTCLWTLPKALRATMTDPFARKHLLLVGHQATLLFLAVFWTIMVVAYLLRYWRHLCHDLGRWVFRQPDHRLRLWIALVLPLGIILLRPGWLGALALLSIPLCIKARGKARWPLVTVWTALTLLVFPNWTLLREAAPVMDPASETNLLVRASRLPPRTATERELQSHLASADDPARQQRLQLALAMQAARRGAYEQSTEYLRKILNSDPAHVAARVGLANNAYYLGRFDAALQDYTAARQQAPQAGEIPYNMAQAFFRKLFLPEAGEALKEARSLGFEPPPWEDTTGEANGFTPVAYLGFTAAEVAASCAWEANQYPPLFHLASWRDWLGCPQVPLFGLLAATLFLSLGLVYSWSNQNAPRECENCGWLICPSCTEFYEEASLCRKCGQTAERSKSALVRATLLKNRSRTQGIARAHRISLLARCLPGAGHLATDNLWGALTRWGFLTIGLYLVLFAWAFDLVAAWDLPGLILAEETVHPYWFPLPRAAWPGVTGAPVLIGLVLVMSLYILALLDGAHLRQSLPKQFLIAAVEFERPAPTAFRRPA